MKKKSITIGQLAMFFVAIMGVCFYNAWKKPIERKKYLESTSKPDEKARRKLIERIEQNKNEKKPEKKKYPRALPGGGLDWTGVENAPRE